MAERQLQEKKGQQLLFEKLKALSSLQLVACCGAVGMMLVGVRVLWLYRSSSLVSSSPRRRTGPSGLFTGGGQMFSFRLFFFFGLFPSFKACSCRYPSWLPLISDQLTQIMTGSSIMTWSVSGGETSGRDVKILQESFCSSNRFSPMFQSPRRHMRNCIRGVGSLPTFAGLRFFFSCDRLSAIMARSVNCLNPTYTLCCEKGGLGAHDESEHCFFFVLWKKPKEGWQERFKGGTLSKIIIGIKNRFKGGFKRKVQKRKQNHHFVSRKGSKEASKERFKSGTRSKTAICIKKSGTLSKTTIGIKTTICSRERLRRVLLKNHLRYSF